MRFLVTGVNGTVAPVVVRRFRRAGNEVAAWDRSRVSPDDADGARRFVDAIAPDWIVHAAMGSPEWTAALAAHARERRARFLYVSSSSVFAGRGEGPHWPDATPDADDDYGLYKIACERVAIDRNPESLIVRIGWQIGAAPGGNTMLTYFAERNAADGVIRASARWFPACSFLEDTADTLADLVERGETGVFHVDANPGLNFHEITAALNRLHGDPWKVERTDDFALDSRLADDRVRVAPVTDRLGRFLDS